MVKWTHVCPLLGVALLACATGENQDPEPLGLGSAGSDASGGTEASAGKGTSSGGSGAASGGKSSAGSSTGGTFSFSGTSSFAGTGFGAAGISSAGSAQGGAAGTGPGGASSAGAGGKAAAGAGGKASAGAGGTASAGASGTGGGGSAMCAGSNIPAKSTWKGTASQSDGAYPPAKAFDGDNSTRFSTGTKQVGGEWLQIDFGEVVTLDEITLFTNNDDYFRHYELRLSNTSQDFAVPVIKSADGVTGSIVVPVVPAKAGQYLTIRQTGADAVGDIAWWSLHEVSIACK